MVAPRGAMIDCTFTAPHVKEHMITLFKCLFCFRDERLMEYLEARVLGLSERARRCLASFGAVHGIRSGRDWASCSHDAGTCDLRECVGGLEGRSVTNTNSAGNILEAVMGAAWIWQ